MVPRPLGSHGSRGQSQATDVPAPRDQRGGLSPDSPTDGSSDAEGDGLTYLREYLLQLDPKQLDAQ